MISTDAFEARALQHEIDHCAGLLFLDRVAGAHADLQPQGLSRSGSDPANTRPVSAAQVVSGSYELPGPRRRRFRPAAGSDPVGWPAANTAHPAGPAGRPGALRTGAAAEQRQGAAADPGRGRWRSHRWPRPGASGTPRSRTTSARTGSSSPPTTAARSRSTSARSATRTCPARPGRSGSPSRAVGWVPPRRRSARCSPSRP